MAAEPLGYSESDLTNDLRDWWDEEVVGSNDPFAEPKPANGTIYEVQPEVDSLAVVKRLVIIDKQVGFEIPASVVRRGGYRSFDDMVADLLPKIRAHYIKHRKKKQAVA